MTPTDRNANQERREQARRVAEFLDSKFELPFGWRIGWDGIIGLVPGLGDLVTNFLSLSIVYQAAMLGCPPSVLLRMAGNLIVDNLLDGIPVVGMAADFIWKANVRNQILMEVYLTQPRRTLVRSRIWIAVTFLFLVLALVGIAVLSWKLIVWVWTVVQGWSVAY